MIAFINRQQRAAPIIEGWRLVRKSAGPFRVYRAKSHTGMDASRRLADLAIAAALAHSRGLLPKLSTWGGAELRQALRLVAVEPLPRIEGNTVDWDQLASAAAEMISWLREPADFDHWVAATHGADQGRKGRGAYATPHNFALQLAESTLAPWANSNTQVRVVDPSAGAGSLLIASYVVLSRGRTAAAAKAVAENLYGMELDPASRELACLMLWLAAHQPSVSLARLTANIRLGNSVTHNWWRKSGAPFDALIMNPPWESLRHEVDDVTNPERLATTDRLGTQKQVSPQLPPLYSVQGTGDRNLFKAFVELAPHLVRDDGRLGALVPAAFASDLGMAPLRQSYLRHLRMDQWTSFENQARHFPIDSRYKFGLLTATRSGAGTAALKIRSFAVEPNDMDSGHFAITRAEIRKVGGPNLIIPEFSRRQEIATLAQMLRKGEPFFDSKSFGKVTYRREVDLTLGLQRREFARLERCGPLQVCGDGSYLTRTGERLVPVVEGRMVGRYDFFQKSWIRGSGRTAAWKSNAGRKLEDCQPQYLAKARCVGGARLAICDVTSATNMRTVHATLVPDGWLCGNTAPVLEFTSLTCALAALGVLNSMVFDWVARRLVAGLHLNKFYLEAMVWPKLDAAARQRIERAAMALCQEDVRFRTLYAGGKSSGGTMDFITANAEIEFTVAKAFGLTEAMLREIYDSSESERRGFWRYFVAEPRANEIVATVLARATKRTTLAAQSLA